MLVGFVMDNCFGLRFSAYPGGPWWEGGCYWHFIFLSTMALSREPLFRPSGHRDNPCAALNVQTGRHPHSMVGPESVVGRPAAAKMRIAADACSLDLFILILKNDHPLFNYWMGDDHLLFNYSMGRCYGIPFGVDYKLFDIHQSNASDQ
jgi:hypothetical protein